MYCISLGSERILRSMAYGKKNCTSIDACAKKSSFFVSSYRNNEVNVNFIFSFLIACKEEIFQLYFMRIKRLRKEQLKVVGDEVIMPLKTIKTFFLRFHSMNFFPIEEWTYVKKNRLRNGTRVKGKFFVCFLSLYFKFIIKAPNSLMAISMRGMSLKPRI